jgi:hypothetical protein
MHVGNQLCKRPKQESITESSLADGSPVPSAIGNRVKFLIDTPEAIWALLDRAQVLAAARRFLCAGCVRRHLEAAKCHRVIKRQFKLLEHQGDAIEQKRHEILAAAEKVLQTSSDVAKVCTRTPWVVFCAVRRPELPSVRLVGGTLCAKK